MPYPSRIFAIMAENGSKIGENVAASMLVIIVGLILGSILGYAAADKFIQGLFDICRKCETGPEPI